MSLTPRVHVGPLVEYWTALGSHEPATNFTTHKTTLVLYTYQLVIFGKTWDHANVTHTFHDAPFSALAQHQLILHNTTNTDLK